MRALLLALPMLAAGCDVDPSADGAPPPPPGGATVFFSLDVLPILQQDCVHCHGGAGGLNLESHEGVVAGGNSGPILDLDEPEQSLLVRRLDGALPPTMPLDGPPLPSPEVDRILAWIAEGAQDN